MDAGRSIIEYCRFIGAAIVIILFDQITKKAAWDNLSGQPAIDVFPFLQWVLVFNRGAAFGFLDDAGGFQHYLFTLLAAAVSVFILVWLWKCRRESRILPWALTLVLAGAVGNLIDRLQYRFVIDFIYFSYHGFAFPAFNVADIAITSGAILLIADHFQWFDKGE